MEYSKNTFACIIDGNIQDDRYKVVDDIIYYKVRIYLVLEPTVKQKILKKMRASLLAGHPRFLKTYR